MTVIKPRSLQVREFVETLPPRIVVNLARWISALSRPRRARLPRPPAGAFALLIVMVVAIVASMFVLDQTASAWARRLPRSFVDVFERITDFGLSGWFLYPTGFILVGLAAISSPALPLATQRLAAALAARFGFLFLAIGAPGLFVTIVKRLIGRARPYVGGYDNPFHYQPFAWRPEYASMPSGHAATAAAAAIAIGALWPRTRALMWLYALIIMFSRVVVRAHHPSDVLAGALVGAVGALMVRRFFAARRLVFYPGDLRPHPWPRCRRCLKALQSGCRLRHPSSHRGED